MTSLQEDILSARSRPPSTEAPEREPPASVADVRMATWFLSVLFFGLVLLVFLALVPGGALLRDPDIYWDIATGQKIWQTGSLPRVDDFSHTFRGHPWIAKEWLAQILFMASYALAGWRGIVLLTALAIASAYSLLFLTLARVTRVTVALGVAIVAMAMSVNHFVARPHMFADLMLVAWAAGMLRAVENREPPSFALLPVMALWANLHASFTAGLALTAGLAVEAVWSCPRGERARMVSRWGLFFVLSVGAACATPYGYGAMLFTTQIFGANEALQYIQEWRPVSLNSAPQMIVFPLLLFFLAICNGVKLPFWRASMLMSLLYFSLTAVRFTSVFSIVAPLLVIGPLGRQFKSVRLASQIESDPEFFRGIAKVGRRALYPVYGAIICGIVAFGLLRTAAPDPAITPVGAVDFIKDHNLQGKIYNNYNFGGYLIFRNLETFIDGRAGQLFLEGFMDRLHDTIDKHPRRFVEYLQTFDIKLALVLPDSIEAQELKASPLWEQVYSDAGSVLFQKRG